MTNVSYCMDHSLERLARNLNPGCGFCHCAQSSLRCQAPAERMDSSSVLVAKRPLNGPARGAGCVAHRLAPRKVERVNSVIADVLRSSAGERADDWPTHVPLVEFAINDSASDRLHALLRRRRPAPRRPLTLSGAPDPAGSGEAAAQLMGRVTAQVRALLQERQDRRNKELDSRQTPRGATCSSAEFAVGEEDW